MRYPEIEAVFIQDIEHFIRDCPQPRLHPEARRAMLRKIRTTAIVLAREARTRRTTPTRSFEASGRKGRTWGA